MNYQQHVLFSMMKTWSLAPSYYTMRRYNEQNVVYIYYKGYKIDILTDILNLTLVTAINNVTLQTI